MKFQTYTESFDYFKSVSFKSNEYYLKGEKIGSIVKKMLTKMAHTLIAEDLVIKQIVLNDKMARSIVKKEAVERFHPNNINNKEFWVKCRNEFPLVSVCGGECKNVKNLNAMTLKMSNDMGLFPFLEKLINDSPTTLNVLEIGFGYGNVFFEIKDRCNYYGIDYVIPKSLKKYKNFIEIEKSGIPDYLLNEKYFDVVYSVNVLQHCSQKDRFEYFKQAYDALKTGGKFIFTSYLMTEKNKDAVYWGLIDEFGRGYTHFFNQLTECDWDYEMFAKLDEIGFKPLYTALNYNFYLAIVEKK
jgi:SAM-dependent methyltransferase